MNNFEFDMKFDDLDQAISTIKEFFADNGFTPNQSEALTKMFIALLLMICKNKND